MNASKSDPFARRLGVVGLIISFVGLMIALKSCQISEAARHETFEPRIVVSAFTPLRIEQKSDPLTGTSHMTYRTGRLAIKNTGKGDAFDIKCHIVNPFSHPFSRTSYGYHRFRSESGFSLGCTGDNIEQALSRIRPYNRLLSPGEEQEFCIEDMDIDPTVFLAFIVVNCSYSDKEGTLKGTDDQKVEIGSFQYLSEEMEDPAKRIWDKYQNDDRVKAVLSLTPQPVPATVAPPR